MVVLLSAFQVASPSYSSLLLSGEAIIWNHRTRKYRGADWQHFQQQQQQQQALWRKCHKQQACSKHATSKLQASSKQQFSPSHGLLKVGHAPSTKNSKRADTSKQLKKTNKQHD